MIGAIVTALFVAVLVSSYILIVNRLLRTDEHWSESNMTTPAAKPSEPQSFGGKAKYPRVTVDLSA